MNVRARAARLARARALLDLIGGSWTTQAIGTAVELGIVDAIAARPRRTPGLAKATKCDPDALDRLLRALASLGICEPRADGCHALTPMGELLRGDGRDSVRSWALWCSRYHWPLWADLAGSVRTGRSARRRAGGLAGYAHLETGSAAAEVFNGAMAGLTRLVGQEVARVTRWGGTKCMVDVGGGHGELLATILAARPGITGIVFDLAHAARGAAGHLARAGLASRCEVVTGSFFDAVPEGADTYLLKSILHNWEDDRAIAILRQCRRAMGPASRLLIVERVAPERARRTRSARAILRSDLNMLVGLDGRERTRKEYSVLVAKAGFRLARVAPAALDYSVLEAVPAAASR